MKRYNFLSLALIPVLVVFSDPIGKQNEPVTKEVLGNQNGSEVCLFTLTNKAGNILKLTNYGARICTIDVPDKNGVKDNVTMGSETFETIIKGREGRMRKMRFLANSIGLF